MRYWFFALTWFNCVGATYAQVDQWNLRFEHWVDSTLEYDTALFAQTLGHKIVEPYRANFDALPEWSAQGFFYRTTDAFEGQYAAVISQWYSNVAGDLQIGHCDAGTMWHKKYCKKHLARKPLAISGHYKFIAEAQARAYATVLCYQWNETRQKLDTVSFRVFDFAPADEKYQPFFVGLDYPDTVERIDSIHLSFRVHNPFLGGQLGPRLCADWFPVCNFLYLDDIKIDFKPLNTLPIAKRDQLVLYPNPVSRLLTIDPGDLGAVEKILLFDAWGKLLLAAPHTRQINLEPYEPGLYVLRVLCRDGQWRQHKLSKL